MTKSRKGGKHTEIHTQNEMAKANMKPEQAEESLLLEWKWTL